MVTFSWFMPRQILVFLNHLFFLGMGWCLLLLLYKDARIPSTTLADRNKVRACPAASASAETDSITANCSCICISCSWCHNISTSTWLPPLPTQACQERKGKVLGNSLWNLACEAQIYQSNDCACVHAFVPTLPSHQREEREGVSKGCPYSPLSLFLCAHTHACACTHTFAFLRN